MQNIQEDLSNNKHKILKLKEITSEMNVLMAEDHEVLHKGLKKILTSLFRHVDCTYDGKEALELFKTNTKNGLKYDLIFSDIVMPHMSGIELSKEIRKLSPKQEIAIFSAHNDTSYLLELINIGIRRFIQKPINIVKLLDELFIICRDIYEEEKLSNIIRINEDVIYDKEQKTFFLDDQILKLTHYETLIVDLLVSKLNLSVSNEEIANYLYLNMVDTDPDNIRKMMYKLRKKLPESMIENIHSVGYRIIKK